MYINTDFTSRQGAITVLELPDELLVAVLQLLDPRDVLKMRRCCSRLYFITQDAALWTAIATRLSHSLPLPSLARIRASPITELEQTIFQAVYVRERWLDTRKPPPRRIALPHTSPLAYLRIFEDRFAITIYGPDIFLCDLDGLRFHGNGGQHSWGRIMGKWTSENLIVKSCNAQFCQSTHEVFLSFLSETLAGQRQLIVLSIPISGNPAKERPFRQVACIMLEDCILPNFFLTSLSPEASYVAYCSSRSGTIVLANWKDSNSKSLSLPHGRPDEEYPWNNLICLEIFEPYMIAVKRDHLEIYLLPPNLNDQATSATMTTHGEVVNLSKDFSVASLMLRETGAESLDIVLCLSDIFQVVSFYILRLPRYPSNLSVTFAVHWTHLYADESLAARDVFLGDISLGSRGMRTVWTEKSRRCMERSVVALMADEKDVTNNTGTKPTTEVSTAEVYTTSSADFRDDPIKIACDEVTGRIVLGTRGGQLWVLDCWRSTIPERKPLARFQSPKGS